MAQFDSYRLAEEVSFDLKEEKRKTENGEYSGCSPELKKILWRLTDREIYLISLSVSCNISLKLRGK